MRRRSSQRRRSSSAPTAASSNTRSSSQSPPSFTRSPRKAEPRGSSQGRSGSASKKRITNEDIELLGYNPHVARPEWFVLQVLPVPPLTVRPSITLESGIRSEDDLTHKIVDILRVNRGSEKPRSRGRRTSSSRTWSTCSTTTSRRTSTTRCQASRRRTTVPGGRSRRSARGSRGRGRGSEARSRVRGSLLQQDRHQP